MSLRQRIADTVAVNLITLTTVWAVIYESRAQYLAYWIMCVADLVR